MTRLEAFLARFYRARLISNFQAVASLLLLLLVLFSAWLFSRIEDFPWHFDAVGAQRLVAYAIASNAAFCFLPFVVLASAVFVWWYIAGCLLAHFQRHRLPEERGRRHLIREVLAVAAIFPVFVVFAARVPLFWIFVGSPIEYIADPLEALTWSPLLRLFASWGIGPQYVPRHDLPAMIQYFDAFHWFGPLLGVAAILAYLLFLSGIAAFFRMIFFRGVGRGGGIVPDSSRPSDREGQGRGKATGYSSLGRNLFLGATLLCGLAYFAFISHVVFSSMALETSVQPESLHPTQLSAQPAPDGSAMALLVGGSYGIEALHRVLLVFEPGADDHSPRPLLRAEGLLMGRPKWDPSSDKLLVEVVRTKDYYKWLLVVDAQSGDLTTLVEGPHHFYEPSWSPDGRHVAFANLPDETTYFIRPSLVVVDAATGELIHESGQISSWDTWAWGGRDTIFWSCSTNALSVLDIRTGETDEIAPAMGFKTTSSGLTWRRSEPTVLASADWSVLAYPHGVYRAARDGSSWQVTEFLRPSAPNYAVLPKTALKPDGSAAVFVQSEPSDYLWMHVVSPGAQTDPQKVNTNMPKSLAFQSPDRLLCFYTSLEGGDAIGNIDLATGQRQDLLHLRNSDVSALFAEALLLPALKLPSP